MAGDNSVRSLEADATLVAPGRGPSSFRILASLSLSATVNTPAAYVAEERAAAACVAGEAEPAVGVPYPH